MDQIYDNERIPEKSSYEYNRDVFVLFVNYKQACDFIAREQVWFATEILRLPIVLVTLVT